MWLRFTHVALVVKDKPMGGSSSYGVLWDPSPQPPWLGLDGGLFCLWGAR